MILLLAALGAWMGLAWPYWLALGITAALLGWEHSLVHPDDLSKIDMAFFNINSYIAITLFAGALGGLLL
jgi:4-hydroxybenzoate polyprenyltransferase